VQVYGAANRLLAVFPGSETLNAMYDTFSRQGTVLFQPTVATNTIDVFKKSIDAVRTYKELGGKGVHGLHIEGPWINPSKRGAHIASLIHSPTLPEVKELLEYGKGVITMITLAPEVCNEEIVQLIQSYGVIVSAGHSDATYAVAIEAFDKGIHAVTHLFNAMSPLHHREPGLAGAAMVHKQVSASIIPDGYHVDYAAIKIAGLVMKDRLFAITDAVTETTSGPYQHNLSGGRYEAGGTLSGSAISMHQAFVNLVKEAGFTIEEALQMCSLTPAKVLGCEGLYGKIVPRAAGQFIVLNDQLDLVDVII
jgi:N-acetylglucosamine-6-phosphate deacetylase